MDSKADAKPEKPTTEQKILEMAKKELLRDIKCASMRAEQFGAHSWAKPQKFVPSKRFLRHMLVSASRDNLRKSEKRKTSKVSSASSQSSGKYDDSSRDKSRKRKHSRWDTSPQASDSNLDSKDVDKKKRHHHHHHHHHSVKTKQNKKK